MAYLIKHQRHGVKTSQHVYSAFEPIDNEIPTSCYNNKHVQEFITL